MASSRGAFVAEIAEIGRVAADDARDAMLRLFPLVRYLFSEVSPVPAKAAMAAMGLCRPHPRLPLAPSTQPVPTELLATMGLM